MARIRIVRTETSETEGEDIRITVTRIERGPIRWWFVALEAFFVILGFAFGVFEVATHGAGAFWGFLAGMLVTASLFEILNEWVYS